MLGQILLKNTEIILLVEKPTLNKVLQMIIIYIKAIQ